MPTAAQLPWIVPVMQAPIGPAATPELVAAVSGAGGIGCLGASWTEPAALREQIGAVRRLTDRPFGVNLVLAFDQAERLEVCALERVGLVSLSWGVAPELVARAHAAGCQVLVQAGSVAEAVAGAQAGCDAVIAQGVEAGGHVQGTTALSTLIGQVAAAVGVPVIAAGGLVDAAGVRAAMAAGAIGAMMGTRFVATAEADVHPHYAARVVAGSDTVHTLLFDGGWPDAPHRVLVNSTYERWAQLGRRPPGERPVRARSSASTRASRSIATRPTTPGARRPATSRRCASTPARARGRSRRSSLPWPWWSGSRRTCAVSDPTQPGWRGCNFARGEYRGLGGNRRVTEEVVR